MKQQIQANKIEWMKVELGSITKCLDGDWILSQDMDQRGNIGIIQLKHIGEGAYIDKEFKFISEDKLKELGCTLLNEGDLIVSRMADPICRSCILPKLKFKTVTAVDVTIVRLPSQISKNYLNFIFNSRVIKKQVPSFTTGTTRARISRKNLERLKIPLPFSNGKPNLKEQERIVSILEKAEKQKGGSKKAEELLDEYLKSIFWEMFGKKGFEEVELQKLKIIISRGKSPKYADRSSIKIINQKCIYWDKLKLENIKYLDESSPLRADLFLKKGDILINSTGTGTLGRAVVFDKEGKFTLDSHVTLFRPNNYLNSYYFTFYLKTEIGQKELYSRCVSGSTNQIELSKSSFERLKIPLPPISLQKKFSSIVEHVEKMKESVRKTRQNSEELFNSLMQKAFRGGL